MTNADDGHIETRDHLLPEEQAVGSDDAHAQVQAILEESEERSLDRNAAPSTHLEHRRSEDTVEPPD